MLVETKQKLNKFKDVQIGSCFAKDDIIYIKIPLCYCKVNYTETNRNVVRLSTGSLEFFKEGTEVAVMNNAKVTY